jgi:flagellin-like protein
MKTKFSRNSKAISPIFATLILIAIAVIAGVVVYMFTSGTLATMTNGGTAGQEKVSVQTVQYTAGGTLLIYAEQTSGPAATVNGVILKDANGNTVGTDAAPTGLATTAPMVQGALDPINAHIVAPNAGSYTVIVTTKAGGSFVSSSFVVNTP